MQKYDGLEHGRFDDLTFVRRGGFPWSSVPPIHLNYLANHQGLRPNRNSMAQTSETSDINK